MKKRAFLSYSHKDIVLVDVFIDEIENHLKDSNVDIWYDKEIEIGEKWHIKIQKELVDSNIIIMLISTNFLNSDYIKQSEYKVALELESRENLKVIPLLLSECNFSNYEDLSKRQIFMPMEKDYTEKNTHKNIAFQNLLKFDSSSNPIPCSNRNKYLLDFSKKMYDIEIIKPSPIQIETVQNLVDKEKALDNSSIKKINSSIEKNFNKADKLLNILYPWKELRAEEMGNIKYQYWVCGKKDEPYFYLILFPSTSAPVKAIEHFISKVKSGDLEKPKGLLTVLKNSNVNKSTLGSFDSENIKNKFYTYKDYYWDECIQQKIKDFKYGLEDEEYYIEQYLYDSYEESNSNSIGKVSKIVMDYLENDSPKALLAIIAQAGTGKTTFIEHIISRIDNRKQSQCIFISSEEIKEKFSNLNSLPNIKTIYDLYECTDDPRKFDEQRLSMGLTNGSIIILIDGLEEIIAHFGSENKFDNETFFSSLLSINNELGQCKVIVTSRELNESANEFLNRREVQVYKLKGFNDKLVDEYLIKRFKTKSSMNNEQSQEHIKKAKKYLLEIKNKINNDNKVIPYILDLLCESIEEEFEDSTDELSFEIHDEYPSNHDVIDNIVHSYFFERELTRQTYPDEITSKDLAYIFIGISVEQGWVFSKEKLIEIVELNHQTQYKQMVSNIAKSPLLKKSRDGSFKFKYDFLMNYFLCLFLIQEFSGEDTNYDISKVLSKLPPEIIDDFSKYFMGQRSRLFMSNAKKINKNLLNNIKGNEELNKSAISNLINLLIKVNSQSLNAEKNTELIKELYSYKDNIFKKLYIYNKLVCLDFKNTEIWDSEFKGFENFFGSKFDNTKFIHCSFTGMREYYDNENIWENIIFDSCEQGDIKDLINRGDVTVSAKKKIMGILKDIKNDKYSVNKEEQHYINCLIKYEYIKVLGNSYRLQRKGKQFITNGTITRKTKDFFDCIQKNN